MTGLFAVEGLGEFAAGDRVGAAIVAAAELRADDVLVISQKIVSKAEGRVRDLDRVEPGPEAQRLAAELDRDPALVELVLSESRRVVRATAAVLITETHSGLVCASAGIDSSNVPGERRVALLPADPDASARRIREEIDAACGLRPAVIVSDSFGRPWRVGQAEVAIGCAGIEPLDDWRGRHDRHGNELAATAIAVADQIAAASDLVRRKDAGLPVVVVRGSGIEIGAGDGPGAASLQRPAGEDLFR